MKLLFDANLSPKLTVRLAALFPDSVHVFEAALARFTSDEAIWDYARRHGFMIVTADSDFIGLAEQRGARRKSNAVRIAELEQSARAVLIIRNAL